MSRNFCNFEVLTKKCKSPIPNNKGTNIFSEIGKFFKEKDATSAMNAITAMQYNLLSTARRFTDYETIGGIFMDVMTDSVQLTITEKIWDMMVELVREMAQCFNIEDEQILDMLVNRSGKLRHFIESYPLKFAS